MSSPSLSSLSHSEILDLSALQDFSAPLSPMSHYCFEPDPNSGKSKYVGCWVETPSQDIPLPFSAHNLASLLAQAAQLEKGDYTHQDIAHWCDRFHMAYLYGDLPDEEGITQGVAAIAEDVSAQWELHLANTYSLEQLQTMGFSSVELPHHWFREWHEQLQLSCTFPLMASPKLRTQRLH
jgi:hypothetical protein